MRKQLKLLLLVATVVALFAMAMIVGSAATTHSVGTETELTDALNNAQAGDTIQLTANITVTGSLSITKELTIDGGTNTLTLDSSVTDAAMFSISAKFTLQNITLVADGLEATTTDHITTRGLFGITAAVAFKAENVNSTFKCMLVMFSSVAGAQADFVNCNLTSSSEAFHMIRHSWRLAPTYIKFDGCTISSESSKPLFQVENTAVTLHNCKVTAANDIFYTQSKTVTYNITGEKTKINVDSVGTPTVSAAVIVNFGEAGKTYDMDIQCKNEIIYLQTANAGNVINVYSGTFTCASASYAFRMAGSTNKSAYFANATFIFTAGARLDNITSTGSTSVTVDNCWIEFTGGSYALTSSASAATYSNNTIIVKNIPITSGTTRALFADTVTLVDNVILAPAGTIVNSSLTFTGFEQDVTYATKPYKIWKTFAGDITNTETGAQIYVDTADATTSGLRFNTKLDGGAIAKLVGHDFTATTLLQEVGGYTLKFYTLIAPMDYVLEAGAFTKDALGDLSVSGAKYADILANNTLNRDTYATDGYISYAGALINLQSYERVYAAVAMIEVWNGNAVEATYYAGFDSSLNARTAQQVAVAVQGDEWTTAQKAIVDAYAAGDAAQ